MDKFKINLKDLNYHSWFHSKCFSLQWDSFFTKKSPNPNQINETKPSQPNKTNQPTFLYIHTFNSSVYLSYRASGLPPVNGDEECGLYEGLSNIVPCYKQNVCKICPKIVGVEKS